MILSFVGLSILWLAGLQICRFINRVMSIGINLWVEIGAGFFLVMGMLILWLTRSPFPLSAAAWAAVSFSAVVAIPLAQHVLDERRAHPERPLTLGLMKAYLPHALIILLIALHVFFVLANNLSRDIYPWDAFTTWMYRAKVWVLNNALLEFHTVEQWLQSGGNGYALHAARYPASVSAVAAFASVLSGDWSDQLASLPWFFTTAAIGCLMFGLCRQSGLGALASLIGSYALISVPLVSIHGILAGYADLWMMGSSGMGLAALLLWAHYNDRGTLAVGFMLLLSGCLFKAEGWIWLGLGLFFVALTTLWRRHKTYTLLTVSGALLAGFAIESLQLGPLGLWGVEDRAIHLGPLGQYSLRPYNPLPNYLEMIFMRGNFQLLGPLYAAGLAVLTLKDLRASGVYWLMGILIAGSQWIIFGLSSFSLYAETGTSINRLLMHFLPVFIITAATAWQVLSRDPSHAEGEQRQPRQQAISSMAMVSTLLVVALTTPALVLLDWRSNPDGALHNTYPATELIPVLGDMRRLENGRQQFTNTPGTVAVAKVRLEQASQRLPRYLVTTVETTEAKAVSLYWIRDGDAQVHSYSLDIPGTTLLDTQTLKTFWQQPIKEMGYLVQKEALTETELGAIVALDQFSPASFGALTNLWATPDPITQRSINSLHTHQPAPISMTGWLGLSVLITCITVIALSHIWSFTAWQARGRCTVALLVLWVTNDMFSLRQMMAVTPDLALNGGAYRESLMNIGTRDQLTSLLETLRELPDNTAGISAIAVDDHGKFNSQLLPLLMAPSATVTTDINQLRQNVDLWAGTVVLFGDDPAKLSKAKDQLAEQFAGHNLIPVEGAWVLAGGAQ